MSDTKTRAGRIRTEVHGHVFKIIIDNVAKKNSRLLRSGDCRPYQLERAGHGTSPVRLLSHQR
ncbi:hypothetical protein [Bradyrhizobium centrosematis]|uniref:hypothetical protein n=1 Tax=Bradyrhizobium centrosematis TaxID=1300039 RepID=UPI002166CB0A|nr:hypothetical protein [Bradyrhizobium centrosematis]MCS3761114.1 hypothetical protein [Bradyrhizobium centrosematis]MCS3770998.1 hypothetical protein [Bradyrhizobium centrosematis]